MSTLESIFIKEFKRNIRSRSAVKDIFSLPLPEESKSWVVSESDMYGVNRVPSEGGLYARLNGSLVRKFPRGVSVARKKYDMVKREFARDSEGRYVYEDVKIPVGCMAVISSINLELPWGYKAKDERFGYVDIILNGSKKEYIYIIPKEYLYVTNQTALALSVKNMKNYYGMGYATWESGVVFLHVIPYKPERKYIGTKILATGHRLNYEKEVKCIVDYWIEKDVIPNVVLCNTVEGGNLVLKDTSRGYEAYIGVEDISIGDKEKYGYSLDDSSEEDKVSE